MNDALLLPPIPLPDVESQGFWDALGAGHVAICRCTACRLWMQPPLEHCRGCGSNTAFERASGNGTVFSFIVVRHPAVPGHMPPYVVALVELDEQPGLRLTGILDLEPEEVEVGMAVQADIREIGAAGINGVWWVTR
jgi:uncharacterized OB-fold protein